MATNPRSIAIASCLLCALLATLLSSAQARAGALLATDTGRPDQQQLVTAADESPPADAIALTPLGGGYLSPVVAAPRPFSHLLLRWEARVPPAATLDLALRASVDGTAWTDWGAVSANPDLWVPDDGDEVFWSQEVYAGADARYYQLRVAQSAGPDGAPPALRRIMVSTVDARYGPAAPIAAAAPAAIGRPPVVSRTAWGNPQGQSSQATPVYYPVRHMVVHHTADANSLAAGQVWADRVRAIWSFHTYTRGWGDIGYNYLVDPDGVIYEGRAGGDDAVAFHDTANYGSLGVALIGTYSSADPTAVALDALVDLLAWKAEQKRIDPLGRSFYYGCSISRYCAPYLAGAVVETISGHRQVTPGHTSCPGDRLLAQLPVVRQRVQERLEGRGTTPDNGDLTVEEYEAGFTRTAATWYGAACGYGGAALATYATDSPAESTNSATWRPNLPAAGRYRLLVHIPAGCAGLTPTGQARYRISTAVGSYERVVDQAAQSGWVELGTYSFAAGAAGSLTLDDLTGEPLGAGRAVLFDAARWVPVDESAQRLELLGVSYDATSVAAGELLAVRFTVRNAGTQPIYGQAPEAGTQPDLAATFDDSDGYVYDEGECFLGADGQTYPSFPKEAGRFRVMLGSAERSPACAGEAGGYPWRWGINGRLDPGATRTIIGYIRFRTPGVVTLRAGAIHEYVAYAAVAQAEQQITVGAERQPPLPARYDAGLRPLASVYAMAPIPDNLLARTQNPLSVRRGAALGSFVWYGELRDWGAGGPLPGLADRFMIEQTRTFIAPTSGDYTFELSSDDGAWLWVDGQLVVAHAGLHPLSARSGVIALAAGRHTLAIKYFERSGGAAAGYRVREPGADAFTLLRDGLAGDGPESLVGYGAAFRSLGGLHLSADDLGGGRPTLRYSWDGATWADAPGGTLSLGGLVDGDYALRYQAVDAAGNWSAVEELRLRVDSGLSFAEVMLPLVAR